MKALALTFRLSFMSLLCGFQAIRILSASSRSHAEIIQVGSKLPAVILRVLNSHFQETESFNLLAQAFISYHCSGPQVASSAVQAS